MSILKSLFSSLSDLLRLRSALFKLRASQFLRLSDLLVVLPLSGYSYRFCFGFDFGGLVSCLSPDSIGFRIGIDY